MFCSTLWSNQYCTVILQSVNRYYSPSVTIRIIVGLCSTPLIQLLSLSLLSLVLSLFVNSVPEVGNTYFLSSLLKVEILWYVRNDQHEGQQPFPTHESNSFLLKSYLKDVQQTLHNNTICLLLSVKSPVLHRYINFSHQWNYHNYSLQFWVPMATFPWMICWPSLTLHKRLRQATHKTSDVPKTSCCPPIKAQYGGWLVEMHARKLTG